MLIATDGACKRNGKPDCLSVGAAWIQTEQGDFRVRTKIEKTGSTSQRGEINGLLKALEYAKDNRTPDEMIVIITDSMYLHNTVEKQWLQRWVHNGWKSTTGDVKNRDLWEIILGYINEIGQENIAMQWTRGHLISYSPGKVKRALNTDPSGIELYARIHAIALRPFEQTRIAADVNANRHAAEHMTLPLEIAVVYAVMNATADCLATYIANEANAILLSNATNNLMEE